MKYRLARFGFLLILFATSAMLKAQDSTSIVGQVTDSTGALLPGSTVTLFNKGTGAKYVATTNAQGAYQFSGIPVGTGYGETFAHNGFGVLQVNDIDLVIGVTRTQDAKLPTGSANVQVEVSARTSDVTLNTEDASIGGSVDIGMLNSLPIQSRDSPGALFTLVPGYANGSVTGARTDQVSATVDAMDVNDIAAGGGIGTIVAQAPVDSVEQFTTTVAGLPPAQGTGSGGQTQMVTKHGTNRFHGNINEYNRNTDTESNSWFNNNVGLPRTPIIQNQFGGNIGGPIKGDKLFFFFNFLDNRIIQSSQVRQVVPLDTFRNGQIGYINTSTDSGTGQTCSDSSRVNTNANCITYLNSAQVAQLDPQHIGFDQPLLAFINQRYPHANDLTLGDGVNTGGLRFNTPTPFIETNYVARIDYNLTSKQKIFGRATVERTNASNSILFPGDPPSFADIDRSYGYVVGHTWQISDNKVNQLYYGDNIQKLDFPPQFVTTSPNTYSFGDGLAGPYGSQGRQTRRVPIPELRDDFTWQKGNHTITFGGQFKFVKTNSILIGNFNGYGIGLGSGLPSLDAALRPADIVETNASQEIYDGAFATALGHVAGVSSSFDYNSQGQALPQGSGTSRRYRFYQTELYVGDVWKATPKITVNYGLRYMLYSVPYEVNGHESVQNFTFDQYFGDRLAQSAAGISGDSSLPFITYGLGGKANNGPNLYAPSYKDFAPRVAVSYAPTRRTVINASAGIIFDRTVVNAVNFIQDQFSYLFQATANVNYGVADPAQSLLQDPRIGANLSVPQAPSAPGINIPQTPYVTNGTPTGLTDNIFNYIVDPKLKDPYSIAFTVGVQQELPWHMVMKLDYAGRLGRRLLAQADASQLLDFPDAKSGMLLSQAFTNLEQQARVGATYKNVTPIPWFEDVMSPNAGAPYGLSNTALVLGFNQGAVLRGDFADTMQWIASHGADANGNPISLMPSNVAMASQFAENTYLTNKGFSSYNGLLLSVSKNTSNGLHFDGYFTWSHSIDNVSSPANSISFSNGYGFICDVVRPRECRANSDFDVHQRITGDFVYDLPFGRHRAFLAAAPFWLNEVIGGWSISGIPTFDTGFALSTSTDAYIAGYANNAPAIFVGNRHDVAAHVHKTSEGAVNLFSNSQKALDDFLPPTGFTIGSRNALRGPSQVAFDAGLGKIFPILPDDKLNLKFRADVFNVLNHPTFANGSTVAIPVNIDSPSNFGQINSTSSGVRVAQFGARLEF